MSNLKSIPSLYVDSHVLYNNCFSIVSVSWRTSHTINPTGRIFTDKLNINFSKYFLCTNRQIRKKTSDMHQMWGIAYNCNINLHFHRYNIFINCALSNKNTLKSTLSSKKSAPCRFGSLWAFDQLSWTKTD